MLGTLKHTYHGLPSINLHYKVEAVFTIARIHFTHSLLLHTPRLEPGLSYGFQKCKTQSLITLKCLHSSCQWSVVNYLEHLLVMWTLNIAQAQPIKLLDCKYTQWVNAQRFYNRWVRLMQSVGVCLWPNLHGCHPCYPPKYWEEKKTTSPHKYYKISIHNEADHKLCHSVTPTDNKTLTRPMQKNMYMYII